MLAAKRRCTFLRDVQRRSDYAEPKRSLVIRGLYSAGSAETGVRKVGKMPEWVLTLVQSGLTLVALVVIIMVLAALFMIIFGIATGIDERIQE